MFDLLKTRIKVIADYPRSPYEIGEILNFDSNGFQTGGLPPELSYFERFPQIFKVLKWSEERKITEMPHYLKVVKPIGKGIINQKNAPWRVNTIFEALPGTFIKMGIGYRADAKGNVVSFDAIMMDCFEPSTREAFGLVLVSTYC